MAKAKPAKARPKAEDQLDGGPESLYLGRDPSA